MVLARNEETVRAGFWPKLAKVLANDSLRGGSGRRLLLRLRPRDAAAASRASCSPRSPISSLPIDIVPDFILGLGFTDDMTVLMTAISLIRTHMRPEHRDKAQRALERLKRISRVAFARDVASSCLISHCQRALEFRARLRLLWLR